MKKGFIVAVALLATVLHSCKSTPALPWANIESVIPAVEVYLIDSTQWVTLGDENLDIDFVPIDGMAPEAYSITVDNKGVLVTFGPGGEQRALATLMQLQGVEPQVKLPVGIIEDKPAFAHRGVLMDVCRHFFTKDEVKRQLDIMHFYKFNVLHWHLTEDQGWRIPIPGYPELTKVAAYRTHGDSIYGGHYTREELVEIVEYAGSLGIEVIPEIELPGHSQAAIAAYPHLGCTGEPVEVATDWGVFKDIYCAGNESTFEFLEDVLDEVCEIFPSDYIHIGGDEAPKYRWEHCNKCQQRIAQEGIANEEELQRYFITRIEHYLAKKGKRLIGWDEILEGGLSPDATVQSWRGFEGALAAARQGHDAIVSPTSHAYFDYPLSSIDLPKVYEFNPIPVGLEEQYHHHILGGECNLWSERIPDIATLDKRFLPRALAMSEVLWRNPEERNLEAFQKRLGHHYPLLTSLGYGFDYEQIPAKVHSKISAGQLYVDAQAAVNHVKIHLHRAGAVHRPEIPLPMGRSTLEVTPEFDGQRMGAPMTFEFAQHLGLEAAVDYGKNGVYSEFYHGSTERPLQDGHLGTEVLRDGQWVGYFGPNELDAYLSFDTPVQLDSLCLNFLQSRLSWVLIPERVFIDFYTSADEVTRFELNRTASPADEGTFIETLVLNGAKLPVCNKIRVYAPNTERMDANHPAAGNPAWHFVDEIQVYGTAL